jgi:hypothetical protein
MLSVWDRMLDDMQLAGLAERTQYAYLGAARRLADHVHKPSTSSAKTTCATTSSTE